MSDTTKIRSFWTPEVIIGAASPFLVAAYVVPAFLWNAYVLTRLWDWYITSAFGASPLQMVHAYGIGLIVHFLQPKHIAEDKSEWYVKVATPFLGPTISLAAGWVGTFWL